MRVTESTTYLNLTTWGLGLSLRMFGDLEIFCNRPKNIGYFGAVGNHEVVIPRIPLKGTWVVFGIPDVPKQKGLLLQGVH